MTRRFWLFAIIGFTLINASCSGGGKAKLPPVEAAKKEAQPKKVETPKTEAKSEGVEYRLLGQVSSQEKIYLAFKVPGNIRKFFARPGSKVKKGQIVAELDTVSYELRAQAAKLQLEKASNSRAQAERDFKIEQELRTKDISSLAQFQNAELAYKNAVVAQSLAEVDNKTAQKSLSDAHLTAPADGVISAQYKFVGDAATGGAENGATFEMFATADQDIYLNAPESLLEKLAVGAKLDVSFPAINLTLPASIVRMVPVIREADRTFLVVARLTKRDDRVVPGLFVEARVKNIGK